MLGSVGLCTRGRKAKEKEDGERVEKSGLSYHSLCSLFRVKGFVQVVENHHNFAAIPMSSVLISQIMSKVETIIEDVDYILMF